MWTYHCIKLSWYSCLCEANLTRLIIASLLSGVIFFWFERILLLMCIVLQFVWRKGFLFHLIYLKGFSFISSTCLHSLSHFFSLSQPLFSSSGSVFQFVSSNIVEDLLINPSAYVFVLRDFNVYHKDWLTYSDGTGRSGELYCNFFYLKPPYADGKRSYSDTWLWFSESCSFELLFFSRP